MRDTPEYQEREAIMKFDGKASDEELTVMLPYQHALALIDSAGGVLELMEIAAMLKKEVENNYEWTQGPLLGIVKKKWAAKRNSFTSNEKAE